MSRELTRAEIDDILLTQTIGRLGLIDDGVPYVVPVSYAYYDGAIYGHSAPGRKARALRSHPEVCFEVEDVESLTEWRSVIAWGTFEQLLGDEAARGMDRLIARFRPMLAPGAGHPGGDLGMMRMHGILEKDRAPAEADVPVGAVVFRVTLHTLGGRAEGSGSA